MKTLFDRMTTGIFGRYPDYDVISPGEFDDYEGESFALSFVLSVLIGHYFDSLFLK